MYLNFLFADLGGHKVFVGSRVNVRWKGEWYVGKVLKLGPKRNLCRVRLVKRNHGSLDLSCLYKFEYT